MGVDCRIVLPPAARLRDVADVIGALAGLPMVKHEFSTGYSGHCDGVTSSSFPAGSGLAACAKIEFHAPIVNESAYVMYHFEGGRNGERLLIPRSLPFWIAVGRGLVDFFGGSISYTDYDSHVDYEQPARPDIHAEDGDEWDSLQDRKLAVKALTKADLKACRELAAY